MSLTRPLVILLLLALLGFLALQRCAGERPQQLSRSRILMGTVVEISASSADPGRLEAAVTDAFAEMTRIEGLMRPAGEGSDVARLTVSEQGTEVAPETAEVIALGLQVAAASGGAFDMGLGRLKALWGIETETPRVPAPPEIRQALAGAGLGDLRLDGRRVEKAQPALAVDLGAIAKGYAVDRAVEVLRRAGIESAAVNAGGNIRLIGDHGGRPWRIAIQHPREAAGQLAVLELVDTSVSTSGDYERFFEQDGVRYHHILDPRTGYPAGRCQSVTVVTASAALADALSTAAFVLGPEEGLALLQRFPATEGLIVAADGTRHASPGLEARLTWR
ncbi:MAG TPA: FAD:protein FMN transferase [Desulfuromonadales bacterium]